MACRACVISKALAELRTAINAAAFCSTTLQFAASLSAHSLKNRDSIRIPYHFNLCTAARCELVVLSGRLCSHAAWVIVRLLLLLPPTCAPPPPHTLLCRDQVSPLEPHLAVSKRLLSKCLLISTHSILSDHHQARPCTNLLCSAHFAGRRATPTPAWELPELVDVSLGRLVRPQVWLDLFPVAA